MAKDAGDIGIFLRKIAVILSHRRYTEQEANPVFVTDENLIHGFFCAGSGRKAYGFIGSRITKSISLEGLLATYVSDAAWRAQQPGRGQTKKFIFDDKQKKALLKTLHPACIKSTIVVHGETEDCIVGLSESQQLAHLEHLHDIFVSAHRFTALEKLLKRIQAYANFVGSQVMFHPKMLQQLVKAVDRLLDREVMIITKNPLLKQVRMLCDDHAFSERYAKILNYKTKNASTPNLKILLDSIAEKGRLILASKKNIYFNREHFDRLLAKVEQDKVAIFEGIVDLLTGTELEGSVDFRCLKQELTSSQTLSMPWKQCSAQKTYSTFIVKQLQRLETLFAHPDTCKAWFVRMVESIFVEDVTLYLQNDMRQLGPAASINLSKRKALGSDSRVWVDAVIVDHRGKKISRELLIDDHRLFGLEWPNNWLGSSYPVVDVQYPHKTQLIQALLPSAVELNIKRDAKMCVISLGLTLKCYDASMMQRLCARLQHYQLTCLANGITERNKMLGMRRSLAQNSEHDGVNQRFVAYLRVIRYDFVKQMPLSHPDFYQHLRQLLTLRDAFGVEQSQFDEAVLTLFSTTACQVQLPPLSDKRERYIADFNQFIYKKLQYLLSIPVDGVEAMQKQLHKTLTTLSKALHAESYQFIDVVIFIDKVLNPLLKDIAYMKRDTHGKLNFTIICAPKHIIKKLDALRSGHANSRWIHWRQWTTSVITLRPVITISAVSSHDIAYQQLAYAVNRSIEAYEAYKVLDRVIADNMQTNERLIKLLYALVQVDAVSKQARTEIGKNLALIEGLQDVKKYPFVHQEKFLKIIHKIFPGIMVKVECLANKKITLIDRGLDTSKKIILFQNYIKKSLEQSDIKYEKCLSKNIMFGNISKTNAVLNQEVMNCLYSIFEHTRALASLDPKSVRQMKNLCETNARLRLKLGGYAQCRAHLEREKKQCKAILNNRHFSLCTHVPASKKYEVSASDKDITLSAQWYPGCHVGWMAVYIMCDIFLNIFTLLFFIVTNKTPMSFIAHQHYNRQVGMTKFGLHSMPSKRVKGEVMLNVLTTPSDEQSL